MKLSSYVEEPIADANEDSALIYKRNKASFSA